MRGQMTHLDTDVLAEFRAGLITGRRGARITAHLGGCERCTALDEQLAGVRSLLASVPAPAMPDSVARRLDTVLAAEVAQRDAVQENRAERAGGDGARESPAPRRPGGNRGFRLLTLRVLAPAAAVVVLAAGGYGLSRVNLGSSTESSSAGSAAQGAAPTAAASAKSGGSVNAPNAGPTRGALSRPQGITAAGITVVTGHANLSHADLGQQVRAELNVSASARTTRAATSTERGCVLGLIGHHQLELVESVLFEGSPATLVVARTGAGDMAWLAAPGCSATHRHVLDTTSLSSGISGP